MSRLQTPSPDPEGTSSDEYGSEDEFVMLGDIPTLATMFKEGEIHAAAKTYFPHDPTLLDRVSLFQGDITKLQVDSIVNAANRSLLGGGGVDGAIHAAAGPGLLEECRTLGGCETGFTKISTGHKLPSKHVLHTVGPIYSRSNVETKAKQLRSCYRTSLELAVENRLKHIAFCSVSTGIYGYPIADATSIALEETRKFLDTKPEASILERVIFVVWSNTDRDVYRNMLPEYFPPVEGEESKEDAGETEEQKENTSVSGTKAPEETRD